MKKTDIVSAIEKRVKTYSAWRIGLTHDPAERKKYWKETKKENVSAWTQWIADSLEDAQAIETHFIKKGMDGGEGGELSAWKTVYVYIF